MQTPTAFSACGALFALLVMADSSFSRAVLLPECGMITGSAEMPHGRGASGLHIIVHGRDGADTAVTNRNGSFSLQVPGPGALLVVRRPAAPPEPAADSARGVRADSVQVTGLLPQRGYVMELALQGGGDDEVRIGRVETRLRPCAGPPR